MALDYVLLVKSLARPALQLLGRAASHQISERNFKKSLAELDKKSSEIIQKVIADADQSENYPHLLQVIQNLEKKSKPTAASMAATEMLEKAEEYKQRGRSDRIKYKKKSRAISTHHDDIEFGPRDKAGKKKKKAKKAVKKAAKKKSARKKALKAAKPQAVKTKSKSKSTKSSSKKKSSGKGRK